MKKLLVMLMVVAMASFLFVGCLGGVTPDVDVDEDVAVTGVTLDKATLALTVGDAPVTLVATVAPADATDPRVIWASSDEAVAIVALGVVTPLNAGISAITATTVDGPFVATCVVTVAAEGVPAPTSTTPTILDIQDSDGDSIVNLTSTKTQYINKTEAGTSILVVGIAGPKALVQVYIGSAATPVSAGTAGTSGLFSIVVTEIALGADSLVAKTLHVTSTELGLIESAASNVATFILDTDLPGIDSVAFTAKSTLKPAEAKFVVTVETGLVMDPTDGLPDTDGIVTVKSGGETVVKIELSGTEVPVQTFEAGSWVIAFLKDTILGIEDNILVTSPSGVRKFYTIIVATVVPDSMIPGIRLYFDPAGSVDWSTIGNVTIKISEVIPATAKIAGRATLKFDEDVDFTGMAAGTYAGGLVAVDPTTYKAAINTGYWKDLVIYKDTPYTITVYGVKDPAGNVGGSEAVPLTKSAIAGAASATLLKP